MSKKTFYITTPIYYPSGSLHIGHVYTTTLARTFANYKSLMGYDVKMLTGADEHGQKIEMKAKEAGIDPQKYVDGMTEKFKELWKLLDIEIDYYSRTTDSKHVKAVQKQFTQLLGQKDIYKGEYEGLYSVQDEEFITKSQAEEKDGEFYHPVSKHKLEKIKEETFFFKMSEYQEWLSKYFKDNPKFVQPENIVKELNANFLSKGLEDLSVSRSTFTWGIPILEDETHVQYVWLDALNNYITALGYNSENDSDFKKYWQEGDEIVHLVGKEITRFHCIYWPIILKAAGIKQPTNIISHGWIITPEGKMSKSKGNVVDPIGLIEKYGAEQVKYFFASQINFGSDGVFDELAFKNAINADLANNFGNLHSRTIAMFAQNFDKPVTYTNRLTDVDKEIFKDIETHSNEYVALFDDFKINKALEEVMKLGKKLNGYIDITMPWTLKEDKERLEVVLNTLLNGIYAMTTMLSVIIPNKAKEALKQLGFESFDFDKIKDFNKFDKVIPVKDGVLFNRIK